MAFNEPRQLKRLVILVSLWMLSVATSADERGHEEHGSKSSPEIHHAFNRTVVLNSASEHYLAMIFHDYSDNATEKISAARFKDMLRDLRLGEKASSPSRESFKRRHRHARSYQQQAGEFARGVSVQRTKEKLPNTYKRKEQLNFVPRGSPARSRDRKRRLLEGNQYSHEDHEEVRY